MTHVLEFVEHTSSDLRSGRHSWRVRTFLWTVALTVAITARMMLH